MEASEHDSDLQLTSLPIEVLNRIFTWVDPASLVTASRACRLLHSFIKGNESLYRSLYLMRMVCLPFPVIAASSRLPGIPLEMHCQLTVSIGQAE